MSMKDRWSASLMILTEVSKISSHKQKVRGVIYKEREEERGMGRFRKAIHWLVPYLMLLLIANVFTGP